MKLDCISTVVKIGVGMIQNATKWKEFLSLGTGGGGDSVKSKFGQSVPVFLLMCEYFTLSFKVLKTSSLLLFSDNYEKTFIRTKL
jgi:hypothetical protein